MGFFDFFKAPDIDAGVRECKSTPGAVLLDVREADEYAAGHIPGSLNLPLSAIRTAEVLLPDFSAPLYVYCLVGSRSARAVSALRAMGYDNAHSIGGIQRWHGEIEK